MEQSCTRCILPETWPGIRFDEEGVCNICRQYEKRWSAWLADPSLQAKSRKELDRIVSWAKRKRRGKFDVLVPMSGGKDSLYVLYWLKKEYDLSVLCYTYDNSLLNETAVENIRLAREKLEFEHTVERHPFQKDLIRHFLVKTGNFCGACVIPVYYGTFRIVQEHGIPLVVSGFSKRTDANLPEGNNPAYFKKVVQDGFGMNRIRPLWGRNTLMKFASSTLRRQVKMIALPDYILWDENKIGEILTQELGVELGVEHSDCIGHEISNWLALQRYGFSYLPIKLSQLIRAGRLSREEAMRMLAEEEKPELPSSVTSFIERAGLSLDDVRLAARQSNKKYYRGFVNAIFRLHRAIFVSR